VLKPKEDERVPGWAKCSPWAVVVKFDQLVVYLKGRNSLATACKLDIAKVSVFYCGLNGVCNLEGGEPAWDSWINRPGKKIPLATEVGGVFGLVLGFHWVVFSYRQEYPVVKVARFSR
jgi:hypothetical protein